MGRKTNSSIITSLITINRNLDYFKSGVSNNPNWFINNELYFVWVLECVFQINITEIVVDERANERVTIYETLSGVT